MDPTRIAIEGDISEQATAQDDPRRPSGAGNRQVPPSPDDDLMDYAGLHQLLDRLAAAIHAFSDQLAAQVPVLGSMMQGNIRIVATHTFPIPGPADGGTGSEPVYLVSASLVRLGAAGIYPASIGEGNAHGADRPPLFGGLPKP